MELVSVLIPAHVKHNYLVEVIESIIAQSYVNLEIVIVVNGTLITNKLFLDSLKKMDNRIKLCIYDLANPNISKVLNYGLLACKSDIIFRIDSDDIMLEDRILKQVKFLKENDDISVVASGYKILNEKIRDVIQIKSKKPGLVGFPLLYFKSCIAAPSVAYRRKDIIMLGGYTSAIGYAEDWDLYIRAVKSGYKIFLTDEVLTAYRIHDNQMTSNTVSSFGSKMINFLKITFSNCVRYKNPIFIVSFLFKLILYTALFLKHTRLALFLLKKRNIFS